jgi:hypothetical protein
VYRFFTQNHAFLRHSWYKFMDIKHCSCTAKCTGRLFSGSQLGSQVCQLVEHPDSGAQSLKSGLVQCISPCCSFMKHNCFNCSFYKVLLALGVEWSPEPSIFIKSVCFEHILLIYSKGLGTSSGNFFVYVWAGLWSPKPWMFTYLFWYVWAGVWPPKPLMFTCLGWCVAS